MAKDRPIQDENAFREAIASGRKLALFYGSYCPFCTSFLKVFEKHAPKGSLKVLSDELDALEDLYSVQVVPTVLFFEDGRLADRLDGILGEGLSARMLTDFMARCGV